MLLKSWNPDFTFWDNKRDKSMVSDYIQLNIVYDITDLQEAFVIFSEVHYMLTYLGFELKFTQYTAHSQFHLKANILHKNKEIT